MSGIFRVLVKYLTRML